MRLGLSDEELPPCWSDDVRMNALFAPFRLKTANPESWEMKMKFWSDMIRALCSSRGDPVISAAEVKVAFQRRGRTPACIDIVVEEMYRNGDLVPLTKYQKILQNGPEGWVRWGARVAFKPAALALTAVSSFLLTRHAVDNDGLPKASIESTQKFVLESVLKEQSSALLDAYPAGVVRVGTIAGMMARCACPAGRDAFETALGCLVLEGRAVLQGDLVKLAEPNSKVTPIDETDMALVKLTTAELRLEGDATRLSRDVSQAESAAKAALALGNRLAAKNHLRRKHKAASRLDRCAAALDDVKQLIDKMRDVSHNIAIVDTYKTAAEAMKKDMKENNMSEDAVHGTMDYLKDVMDTYNEIENVLSSTTVEEDTADLEAELKELLARPGDCGGSGKTAETSPPAPLKTPRKVSEREFVFDGEERILAELNELGVEESSPGSEPARAKQPSKQAVAVPVAEWTDDDRNRNPEPPKTSKSWYPPSSEWNNNFAEVRQDERLHPGQPLNIDFTRPPRLYANDFAVQDHKMDSGVWLFNKDGDSTLDELRGTEYYSSESPGKTGGNFQMAPGGERKKEPARNEPTTPTTSRQPAPTSGKAPTAGRQSGAASKQPDDFDDLERRLKNLRGFNL